MAFSKPSKNERQLSGLHSYMQEEMYGILGLLLGQFYLLRIVESGGMK